MAEIVVIFVGERETEREREIVRTLHLNSGF